MSSSPQSPKAGSSKLIIGGGVVLLAIILLFSLMPSEETSDAAGEFHDVKKGEFLVTVVEGGNLEAVNEVGVRNEMRYTSKIVSIVDEGTYIKKGDLICELDVSEIEDKLDQQKLSVESAEFDLTQAQENLKIQESIIESNIKAADLKVEFAKIDMNKYIEGDQKQAQKDAETAILQAQEKMDFDEENHSVLQELHAKGFETKSKVEQAYLTKLNSKIKWEQAVEAKRLLEEYDNPKKLRQFESDHNEAKADFLRVEAQSEAKRAQYKSQLRSAETKLDLTKKKLEEYENEIKAAKVYAPEDGMVVYPFVSYRSSSQTMIEEGASVRPQQTIVNLPDTSKMKLGIKVHESHINQVSEGLPAYVVLDPFPDKRFKARVTKVALLPDSQSRYSNPNLKVYSTEVVIEDQLPNVKPGVSGRAEIIITKLESVITVPIQSVTTYKGKQVVYVKKSGGIEPVEVTVGLFNNKFIEIREGLEEGDLVAKSPKLDFEGEEIDDSVIKEGDDLPEDTPVNERPEDKPKKAQPKKQQAGQGGARKPNPEMIKRFDKDGDGKLSADEQKAMRDSFRNRQGGGGGGGGRPQGGGGGGGRPGASIDPGKALNKEFAMKEEGPKSAGKNFAKQARKEEKSMLKDAPRDKGSKKSKKNRS